MLNPELNAENGSLVPGRFETLGRGYLRVGGNIQDDRFSCRRPR
jgi:hypothetical protein